MSSHHGFVYFFLLFLAEGIRANLIQPSVHVRMGPFSECETDSDLSMSYTNVSVDRMNDDEYKISGTLNVEKELPNLAIQIYISTCKDADFNECEVYTVVESDGCKELKDKDSYAYKMFQSAGHDTECPVPKGQYVLENYIVKISQAQSAPAAAIAKWWLAQIEMTTSDEVVLCNVHKIEIDNSH